MKLYTFWMQRKERYEGEYGPECLLAWDEFSREGNPEGFEEAIEEAKRDYDTANQAAGTSLVVFEVDGESIRNLCLQNHEPLAASITKE